MNTNTCIKSLSQAISDIATDKSLPILSYIEQLGGSQDEALVNVHGILDALCHHAEREIEAAGRELEGKIGKIELVYLDGALVEMRRDGQNADEAQPATEKRLPDDIPDFRTVEPGSDQAAALQRVFGVMREGGPNWNLLESAIAFTWESHLRGEGAFLKRGAEIWTSGVIERTDEPEQAADSSARGGTFRGR